MTDGTAIKTNNGLTATLVRQRAAFLCDGPPSLARRRSDLMKLKDAIWKHREDFVAAINTDFGHRSRQETILFDLASVVDGINYLRRNLRRWMRPERRRVGLAFFPASNWVLYQPLGVVGIISPWNYPVALALMPLATALAAGNRAMIKPSELTPQTSASMKSVLGEFFVDDQVAVVTGDASIGIEFSRLPFDHLLFTGSTSVGRSIMHAASDNLTPVTLELGGKSPAIIERGPWLSTAALRIAYGKLANGGQTCIAPDYVLVAQQEVDAFVDAYEKAIAKLYPNIASNPDYTSIVNDRHYARLTSLLDDARNKGARVIEVVRPAKPGGMTHPRRMVPTVVLNVTDEMNLMRDEIFGPICRSYPIATSKTPSPTSIHGHVLWPFTFSAPMVPDGGWSSSGRHPVASQSTKPTCIMPRRTFRLAASDRAVWAPTTATKASRLSAMQKAYLSRPDSISPTPFARRSADCSNA